MIIACWQATPHRGQRAAPLDRIARVAERAAAAGADLLVTPELSTTGYQSTPAETVSGAEPLDGPLNQAMGDIAARAGIAIVYGWPERTPAGLHNSVQLVDATGRSLAVYRKTHLYGAMEHAVFVPGDQAVVQAKIGDLVVGLLVCFDVEFPETVRAHALSGTDLLVVPTALESPWEFVARAVVPVRAFESQLYVCYANWVGRDGQRHFCGMSQIAWPDGTSEQASPVEDQLLVVNVDRETLHAARAATPYLRDRRPGLYGRLLGPTTDREVAL